jgi:hypothetical protein
MGPSSSAEWTSESFELTVTDFVQNVMVEKDEDPWPPDDPWPPRGQGPPTHSHSPLMTA